jgi:hypothetical protein
MLNNKQLQNKLETEKVVDQSLEVLNDIRATVEKHAESKDWVLAYNSLVNLLHGAKLLHGALDTLSDCENLEKNVMN